MKKVAVMALLTLSIVGCGSKTITISKCKTYENDICVSSEIKKVTLCEEPQIIEGKTYCK